MHVAVRDWVKAQLPQSYRSLIEVGSLDINGGILDLLLPSASYVGIDVQSGPGVDVVADFSGYLHGELVDVVLCLEVFEHTEKWRDIIEAASENLESGGLFICTCATHGRAPHSAESQAPIGAHEFYANVDPAALDLTLDRYFASHAIDVQGNDLRGWGRKA